MIYVHYLSSLMFSRTYKKKKKVVKKSFESYLNIVGKVDKTNFLYEFLDFRNAMTPVKIHKSPSLGGFFIIKMSTEI